MNLKIIILVVLFVLVSVGQVSGVDIDSCTTITSPGTYVLTQDIINSNAHICINITASNVVFDGQGYTIDGTDTASTYGIYVRKIGSILTGITIRDTIVTDWLFGIALYDTTSSAITNNTVNSNEGTWSGGTWGTGIYFDDSAGGTITNNIANSNAYTGIWIRNSNSNSIANNIVNSNGIYGVYLGHSDSYYNTIEDNTINSNSYYGIMIASDSDSNTVRDNSVSFNSVTGIYIFKSNSNIIYNNLFNNTNNAGFYSTTSNDWNTTKTLSTNIIGGPYLGGNFWAKPNGNGFSETCTDADGDGICDSSHTLASGNVDYLPLSLLVWWPYPITDITETYNDSNEVRFSQSFSWTPESLDVFKSIDADFQWELRRPDTPNAWDFWIPNSIIPGSGCHFNAYTFTDLPYGYTFEKSEEYNWLWACPLKSASWMGRGNEEFEIKLYNTEALQPNTEYLVRVSFVRKDPGNPIEITTSSEYCGSDGVGGEDICGWQPFETELKPWYTWVPGPAPGIMKYGKHEMSRKNVVS